MTFRETLDKHLRAIQERDHQALAETLPTDQLVLITSDGRLVRSPLEFAKMHREWFASKTWTLDFEEVSALESTDLAVVTFRLDYRDQPEGGSPIHERSFLTLVFRRLGDHWLMVQDQNTPIRATEEGG